MGAGGGARLQEKASHVQAELFTVGVGEGGRGRTKKTTKKQAIWFQFGFDSGAGLAPSRFRFQKRKNKITKIASKIDVVEALHTDFFH